MDFLWHKVSDKEKEEIRKEAKNIMDSFSEKLSKVKKKIPDSFVERDEMEREEISSSTQPRREPQPPTHRINKENEFREKMFENAPNKNKDFILGERKGW